MVQESVKKDDTRPEIKREDEIQQVYLMSYLSYILIAFIPFVKLDHS